ncbi:TRAP dicarboxylate transporter- DctM subunit [Rhodoferax ferrireducens T118]|uniref:TRAP transporter large permease protein n=1 Tax=Albidiferax ferrireducens (strain ATCC BAA-621 / DSM 15236 / T118) TaxID=338969 RepID=Q21QS1_ALBFT|nr:TRAP transporter large permease subunit [Rhodoferax ferrireducens]ABD71882.1 TRAP dicarboxylate transporter- DctM subunit [Rhodoferax ferrireducens T118]
MAFAVLLFILLLILLTGVPIAYAIGGIAVLGNQWFDATSFTRLAETQFSSVNSFVIMAIPFFILAGNVMLKGQMARSLFEFMVSLTRGITGGAAIGATGACAIFGALTGSSAAAASALAPVVVPELERHGYPRGFACGLIAAGGTLGIMIPPSVVFVVYGSLTSTSVATLFLAGVIPGLFLAALLALTSYGMAKRYGYGDTQPLQLREIWRAFKVAMPSMLMPVVVLGGIYSGKFTPTEAAAVSVVYSVIVTKYVYKTLKWSDLPDIFIDSAKSSAVVLIILAASLGVGLLASFLGAADQLTTFLISFNLSAWQFLLAVNVILLILGCFFDGFTLLVLLTPLLLPSLKALDISLIHFAIILTANIEIAAITPPVGFNLFVISGITKVGLTEVARGVLPFAITLLVGLFILTYVPSLSLMLTK